MEKIREWCFPAALLAGWFVAAAYTVSLLIAPVDRNAPEPPPASGDEQILGVSAY